MSSQDKILKTVADIEQGFEGIKREHFLLDQSIKGLREMISLTGSMMGWGPPKDVKKINSTIKQFIAAANLVNIALKRYTVGFDAGLKTLKEIDFEAVEKLLKFRSEVEKPKQKKNLN